MNTKYKQNWEETRENFMKWWTHKEMCRPLLSVTFAKPPMQYAEDGRSSCDTEAEGTDAEGGSSFDTGTAWTDAEGESVRDAGTAWTDPGIVLDRAERGFGRTGYMGEAFPDVCANLGPGSFGVFLGANPVFAPDTVWYEPCFNDIGETELPMDASGSKWLEWTLNTTKTAARRAGGDYLVSVPDLIENLDTLAAVLGTEKLLYYLVDAPDEVHRLQKQLLPLWFKAFEAIYDIIRTDDGWSSFAFFNLWAPGRVAKLQCDFSAFISPKMFDEFVLPYLTGQAMKLDYTIYHLDGPDAVCHLDSLLKIDSLHCIQWVPGAGKPDNADPCWDYIYRRILNAGKCIQAFMPAGKVKDFVKRFGKTGVYIQTYTDTAEEAEELFDACTG